MTTDTITTAVEILGKTYSIKCPENEAQALHQAAHYLEQKIQEAIKTSKTLCIERAIIVSALNLTFELLALQQKNTIYLQNVNQRLRDLQSKLETALVEHAQMELSSAE